MAKKVDRIIEITVWIITSLLLIKYVPKDRIREASLIFLFKQLMTWIFGLLVVEKKLIIYPTRLFFQRATKSSFTFEYFVYPALCVLFNLYYSTKKSKFYKIGYYFAHTSFITVTEIFLERYTKLIKYRKWSWYWTFITIWATYYLSHLYHQWFLKKPLQTVNGEN